MSIFATKKTLETLKDRLGDLSTEFDALKRANRSLELEFTELYDKVRHQMSRMAKRAAVDLKDNANGLGELPPEADPNAPDPISASILQRRGMRRPQR